MGIQLINSSANLADVGDVSYPMIIDKNLDDLGCASKKARPQASVIQAMDFTGDIPHAN